VGNKLKVNEKFWKKKAGRKCEKIARETGTEIEICSINQMNLIFLVKGQHDDITKAKFKIIETFQIQVNYLLIDVINTIYLLILIMLYITTEYIFLVNLIVIILTTTTQILIIIMF